MKALSPKTFQERILPNNPDIAVRLIADDAGMQTLRIECPTIESVQDVRRYAIDLASFCDCDRADIQRIEIVRRCNERITVIDSFSSRIVRCIMENLGGPIQSVSEWEVFDAFSSFLRDPDRDGISLSLVEHESHKGIITVNNAGICKIPEAKWCGQDMSLFWEPEQLARSTDAIDKHGVLDGFNWTGLTMDGELRPVHQWGDIRLIEFQGRSCRLVTVKSFEVG